MLLDAPPRIRQHAQTITWLVVVWICVWSQLAQWLSPRVWPTFVMLAPLLLEFPLLIASRPRLYSMEADLPWVIWQVRPGSEKVAPEVVLKGSARTEWLARKACDWGDQYGTRERHKNARYHALEEWLNEENR